MRDYYQILGLDRSATLPEARAAYLRLAKELHPDLNPGDAGCVTRFQEVQEAWQVLSQAELREDYDGFLHGFEDEGHGEDGAIRLAEQHAGYREEFLKQELLAARAGAGLQARKGSLALPVLLALSLLLLGAMTLEDNGQAEALHLANRLGFGPRAGQVQEIQKLGSRAWIEQQLKPEAIEDKDCDARLKAYPDIQQSALALYKASPPRRKKKVTESDAMMNADMADKANKQANQKLRQMQQQWNAAKLTRLTYSKRQLNELMVEFWFNHFNVSQQKNQVKWLFGPYERDVIRPHALGRFDELLLATAQSPAMLAYLDNAVSTADPRYVPAAQKLRMEEAAQKAAQKRDPKMKGKNKGGMRGLNENYARELLELHTLGVEGGYSQQDVIEAARVLTGWGFQGPAQGGQAKKKGPYVAPFTFVFRKERHDQGEKTVLGQRYGAGQAQGEAMLAMLARHPATAKYLATKLCRRFVADEPPATLVERVAAAYLKADTDIRATLRALFESPEFLDPKYQGAKVKSPLEFVVSSLRAGAAEDVNWTRVDKALTAMGQPLYRCEPPTGYADTADAWLSSSALLDRMNFAVLLKNPKRSPAKVDLSGMAPLALGSPEFQRR